MRDDAEFDEETPEERRIRQLRNQLDEITGGEMILGGPDDKLPLDMQISFLERVIQHELAPRTSWHEKLKATGYSMPDPDSLDDEALGIELWQAIQRLAELRVFLFSTDHLSDRALYEELYTEHLNDDIPDIPMDEDSACHIDLAGSGSEEDIHTWLTYYARDEDRELWQTEYPDETLPPRRQPPFDRDQYLPKRESGSEVLAQAIDQLICADWEKDDGPIRLSNQLPHAAIEHLPILVTARLLMEHLRDTAKVKATAGLGNLPRRVVSALYDKLPFTTHERDVLDRFSKVKNEEDLWLLHAARITCEAARLIKKQKGYFSITKTGRDLLSGDRVGELYRMLFISFFRKISLAYHDRLRPDLPGIQDSLAVILWRLGMVAQDWITLEDLTHQTLLPFVLNEVIEFESSMTYGKPGETLEYRLWRHLCKFGLLEQDPPDDDRDFMQEVQAYRVTPLFEQFLHFNVTI